MFDIIFKLNGIEEVQSLQSTVTQKLTGVEKYVAEAGSILCEVEFEKVAPKQHGQIYRVETNLTVDGHMYRAEATEESFEAAIDKMKDELDTELRRGKNKQTALDRSAERAAKEQLQGGEM